MKTAISIPDDLFQQAEETAKKLGIPRSQLFALALEEFIQIHRKDNITQKLNEIYSDRHNQTDENMNDASIASLRRSLKNDAW